MCVEKKRKTEEGVGVVGQGEGEQEQSKVPGTIFVTFDPYVCFAAKLESTERENTQDQHAAGKLVFHVASCSDVR